MTEVHDLSLRVYYENTDFSGIVYHAEYLRFLERGRTEFLRDLGIQQQQLAQEKRYFVVTHMDIAFKGAATMDDVIVVKTQLIALSRAQLTLQQKVVGEEKILLEAIVKLAFINEEKRPQRLSNTIYMALSEHL